MFKKIGIILFFVGQCLIGNAAFAATQDDGTPCPPECTIDTMEIVTWYPSPYNEYEELRLYPKFSADESDCNSGDKLGLMYYNKDQQALKICWQDPSDLSYSWEKIGSEQSGLLRLGNYATGSRPSCSSAILGALVYDTTEKRPYVCALNASNNPVWKPLDSDYDKDGITDMVDANDNDLNDATAMEANVETGKTFYARGGSRRTGNMNINDFGGLITVGFYGSPTRWYNCSILVGPSALCAAVGSGSGSWQSDSSGTRWDYEYFPCSCAPGYTLITVVSVSPSQYEPGRAAYYCKKN